jgi:hypothetical protein
MKLSSLILSIIAILMQIAVLEAGASVIARTQDESAAQKILPEAAGDQKEIILSPFFLLEKKDKRVWIERVIVTLLIDLPKDCRQEDLNCAASRKMFYELLQTQGPERSMQPQAITSLTHILGVKINATMRISRSTIIVP